MRLQIAKSQKNTILENIKYFIKQECWSGFTQYMQGPIGVRVIPGTDFIFPETNHFRFIKIVKK